MYKLTLLLILCCTLKLAKAQTGAGVQGIFARVIKSKGRVTILAKVDSFSIEQIKEQLSQNLFIVNLKQMLFRETDKDTLDRVDTVRITASERHYIDSCIEGISNFSWAEAPLKNLGASNFKLKDIGKAKPSLRKRVYTIMPPIFMRNNSLCIFFYEYTCGQLCGHGDLTIWKKQGSKWIYWWNITFFDV